MKHFLFFFGLLLIGNACSSDSDSDLDLIVGRLPDENGVFHFNRPFDELLPSYRFPASLSIGDCTAALITKRYEHTNRVDKNVLLTAAHCVSSGQFATLMEKYKAGKEIKITRRLEHYDEKNRAFRQVEKRVYNAKIAKTFIHHSYIYAGYPGMNPQIAMDVAVILLEKPLPVADEDVARVTFEPLVQPNKKATAELGAGADIVIKGGYGCESLALAETKYSSFHRLKVAASFFPNQKEASEKAVYPSIRKIKKEVPQFYNITKAVMYLFGDNHEFSNSEQRDDDQPDGVSTQPTLCPGDSGGPLYVYRKPDDAGKDAKPAYLVAGVNSVTRIMKNSPQLRFSAVDLHTRLDKNSTLDVDRWLIGIMSFNAKADRKWFAGIYFTKMTPDAGDKASLSHLAHVHPNHQRESNLMQFRFRQKGGKECPWQVGSVKMGDTVLEKDRGVMFAIPPVKGEPTKFETVKEVKFTLVENPKVKHEQDGACFVTVLTKVLDKDGLKIKPSNKG